MANFTKNKREWRFPKASEKSMFQGRKIIIATKHQKEAVIAPILARELGLSAFVDERLDTDLLGTFSGEVERKLDPIATARQKCLMAMELSGCDLGVASEGSFGPHPSLFFVSANEEFLMLIDKQNDLEIVVREFSADTNFDGKEILDEEALFEFANQVGFPSHGLILRRSSDDFGALHKGITDFDKLKATYTAIVKTYGRVYVETDMRALYNPTRMRVIQKAAEKLVQKIKSTCPQCHTPGFGVTGAKRGLLCSLCGSSTNSVLSYLHVCARCNYVREEMYPNKRQEEDPMYCDHCNP
jgi:hypothetical protein